MNRRPDGFRFETGGDEWAEEFAFEVSGVGAAFLLAEAALPALRFGRDKKQKLSLSLQKAFLVPWGYEKFLPASSEKPGEKPSRAQTLSLIRSILLSGLSIHGSLSF